MRLLSADVGEFVQATFQHFKFAGGPVLILARVCCEQCHQFFIDHQPVRSPLPQVLQRLKPNHGFGPLEKSVGRVELIDLAPHDNARFLQDFVDCVPVRQKRPRVSGELPLMLKKQPQKSIVLKGIRHVTVLLQPDWIPAAENVRFLKMVKCWCYVSHRPTPSLKLRPFSMGPDRWTTVGDRGLIDSGGYNRSRPLGELTLLPGER